MIRHQTLLIASLTLCFTVLSAATAESPGRSPLMPRVAVSCRGVREGGTIKWLEYTGIPR